MKTHQFRYVLFLFALAFFGIASLVYSENGTEQEDSLNNPFQTVVMIFGALTVIAFGVVIYLGLRVRKQQQKRFNDSEQRDEQREQRLLNRFNDSEQRWEGQLKHISQQGKDNTQKLEEIGSNYASIRGEQQNIKHTLSKFENRLDDFELTLLNLEPDEDPDNQLELAVIVQNAREQVESLARAYENGEPIDFIDIEDPTPSQNALRILNWIARTIEDWENELEDAGTADADLIQTLKYANQPIKDKLKEARGQAPSLPTPLELETDVSTDEAYNECNAYVSRFEGMLFGYQLRCEIDEAEYDQFIPQFIRDRLFNSVARFFSFDKLPKPLDEFLQFVGYEVVPIEIGKTKADARVHEIQGSRQTGGESGTIVEVILPGLQRKGDGEILQKPVVIRGE